MRIIKPNKVQRRKCYWKIGAIHRLYVDSIKMVEFGFSGGSAMKDGPLKVIIGVGQAPNHPGGGVIHFEGKSSLARIIGKDGNLGPCVLTRLQNIARSKGFVWKWVELCLLLWIYTNLFFDDFFRTEVNFIVPQIQNVMEENYLQGKKSVCDLEVCQKKLIVEIHFEVILVTFLW